jgi:hypothetical protein
LLWVMSAAPFVAGGQNPPERSITLPLSISVSEVEIGLVVGGGGGCFGRCVRYRVAVSGNGAVTYEDLVQDPQSVRRQRSISVDEVVALLNDFLRAGFLEARDRYVGASFYSRQGSQLLLLRRGGADGTTWDLTLRAGALRKSVHLYMDYPEALGKVRDQVANLGGPQAWTVK